MVRCSQCRCYFTAEDLGDTHKCRDCESVFGLLRGLHDNYGHRLFMSQPDRLARIDHYSARADQELPLFD